MTAMTVTPLQTSSRSAWTDFRPNESMDLTNIFDHRPVESQTPTMCKDEEMVDQNDLAPYPFFASEQEVDDRRQLHNDLGGTWSLEITERLMELDEEPARAQVTPNGSFSDMSYSESDEARAMRNELWKQSLKPSLFEQQRRRQR